MAAIPGPVPSLAVRVTVTAECSQPLAAPEGLAAAAIVGGGAGTTGACAVWSSGAKAPVTSRQLTEPFRRSTPTRQPRLEAARSLTALGAEAAFSTAVGCPLPSR